MLVKAFDRILNEKYFVQDIIQTVNSIGQHIHELSVAIDNETSIPDTAKYIFQDIQRQYQSMINYTQLPLKEVCDYANGKNTDIDRKLLEALDVVHRELKRVIDTINQDILSKITPWQNHMLMDIDFEEQIRSYISLAGTIGLVLVIILAFIPVVFFVFIMISRLCGCDQSGSCENNQ
jgi:Fe2+ transport system protein B